MNSNPNHFHGVEGVEKLWFDFMDALCESSWANVQEVAKIKPDHERILASDLLETFKRAAIRAAGGMVFSVRNGRIFIIKAKPSGESGATRE